MKEQRSCTNESSLSCPFWLSTEIEMDLLLSLLGVTSDDGLGDSFVGPSALGSLKLYIRYRGAFTSSEVYNHAPFICFIFYDGCIRCCNATTGAVLYNKV
jgi:hypothetical protein